MNRICVNLGAVLSLQSHKFGSENWVMVEGMATVTLDNQVTFVEARHSVYVASGAIHRIENLGVEPMV